MTQKDMESIVSGIKKLNGVLVVTIPDCLLYSAWQASEDDWDAEVIGAYLGQLLASGVDGLRSVDEWSGLSDITLELKQGLMVVRPAKGGEFAVGYVFEPGTPLGWVRIQVARTYPQIAAGLGGSEAEEPAEVPVETPGKAPAEEYFGDLSAELAGDVAEDILDDEFENAFAEPVATPETSASDAPKTVAGIQMSKPAPASAPAPESAAPDKGARLIKYLGEHTSDTHAALLRVSLQTGLPLTRLRDPGKLSEEEYAKVEESVRLILGVDQLTL
jgi:hypothetical protein